MPSRMNSGPIIVTLTTGPLVPMGQNCVTFTAIFCSSSYDSKESFAFSTFFVITNTVVWASCSAPCIRANTSFSRARLALLPCSLSADRSVSTWSISSSMSLHMCFSLFNAVFNSSSAPSSVASASAFSSLPFGCPLGSQWTNFGCFGLFWYALVYL